LGHFWPRNVVKRGICYENVYPSVRPSVCLSHSWVTTKRFKISNMLCIKTKKTMDQYFAILETVWQKILISFTERNWHTQHCAAISATAELLLSI